MMPDDPPPSSSSDNNLLGAEGQVQFNVPAEKSFNFRALPRVKKFIVITFSMVNFCVGVLYSALGPFFPSEAAAKGISNTTTGLIFGVFELGLVVMSPVFGNFLMSIGAKFMYCSGVLVSGCCGILFGFLDASPDGFLFSLMCFLVRTLEGIGAAAFMTSSFAIMAHGFPDNVATVFGILELFSGLGFMIGPPIGGALYQLGGFRLPFISFGGFVTIIGLLSIMLLPAVEDISTGQNQFILGLLRIPVVCIMSISIIVGAGAIGFLDIGLANYIYKVYKFTPFKVGLLFIVAPGIYAFTAPVWGSVADKMPGLSKVFVITGYLISGLSLIFLGPAPFLSIASGYIWIVVLSLAVVGLGLGTMVITFQIIAKGTNDYGYSDSLETYGLISGLFNCFFSLGSFLGPLFGGYLIDKLKFPMASAYFGFSLITAGLLYLVYCLVHKVSSVRSTRDINEQDSTYSETSPLHNDLESSRNYHSVDS